jgi:hypothetical protein
MPFSKYHVAEHMEEVRSAFYRVCDALLLKGETDDSLTAIIADKIVTLVKAGEHDVERVLNDFVDDGPAKPNVEPHAPNRPSPSPKVC